MQERVKKLELEYKKFLIRKYVKYFFITMFCLFLVFFIYFIINEFQKKEVLLKQALKEKQDLVSKLQKAKIQEEKNKIIKEKLQEENLNLLEAKQKLQFEISSVIFNSSVLKNEFYKSPSFDKALLLSRLYFKDKDYKKSIFWSLKANEMDKNQKEPWFLFIKAKEALGELDEAKRALETYKFYYDIEIDKF
ncbi:transformation system protein [Campylobacter novaezeelandiae]|uniref:transformation system protein n=1 Tax=Campylobacter novaezeelandiae TaxID=2267891 RepID=UPI001904382D|nr:transformation system protein [Campylobacter novaezeelandiae]MBK1963433.1 transformation system protein [Campylobacter novaezeelandiae]